MCGFLGIYYFERQKKVDRARLDESVRALEHRGPDGVGVYEEPGIGLVHTRLSLLDLDARSNQPFWDESERFAIVYNGEIYNYSSIRRDLEDAADVAFRTTSDTEVVLYALIHYGVESATRKFEGMFSFALYDSQKHEITIVRDRLGIKPLYSAVDSQGVRFASEIKALLPWHEPTANLTKLIAYLVSGEIPAIGQTFFEGVEFVPPGAIITFFANGTHRFDQLSRGDLWDPERAARLASLDDKQLIDELDRQFNRSVQSQLVADATVGALCSGGVDSSLILCIAKRHHDDLAIFHADIVGRQSEYEHARALSDYLKLDLMKVEVTDRDFIHRMPDIIEHWEHPYTIQHNAVAFLKVSELIQSTGTKAVLSGEGSDEAFLGYWWMMFDLLAVVQRNLSTPFSIPSKIWRKLFHGNRSRLNADWCNLMAVALGGYQRQTEMPFILDAIRRHHDEVPAGRELMSFEWLGYHLRHLLIRNDTLGMAASIECRFPFLDTEILKSAVNLPYKRRVRRSFAALDPRHLFHIDKWPVRALADRYMPKRLSKRHKWGFMTSAQNRMQVDWRLFDNSWLTETLAMPASHVESLFSQTAPGDKNRMLHAFVWGEIFMRNTPKSSISDQLDRHVRYESE